jgi:hypothetical protein
MVIVGGVARHRHQHVKCRFDNCHESKNGANLFVLSALAIVFSEDGCLSSRPGEAEPLILLPGNPIRMLSRDDDLVIIPLPGVPPGIIIVEFCWCFVVSLGRCHFQQEQKQTG